VDFRSFCRTAKNAKFGRNSSIAQTCAGGRIKTWSLDERFAVYLAPVSSFSKQTRAHSKRRLSSHSAYATRVTANADRRGTRSLPTLPSAVKLGYWFNKHRLICMETVIITVVVYRDKRLNYVSSYGLRRLYRESIEASVLVGWLMPIYFAPPETPGNARKRLVVFFRSYNSWKITAHGRVSCASETAVSASVSVGAPRTL